MEVKSFFMILKRQESQHCPVFNNTYLIFKIMILVSEFSKISCVNPEFCSLVGMY